MAIQNVTRFTKKALCALILGASLLIPTAHAATELNLAILAGMDDEDYDGAMVFKSYVETNTNGNVQVKIFAGAQLCGAPAECFESMKAGVVDVYNGTAGGAAVLYPAIQALDLPYMFDSDRVVMETLRGPLEREVRERIMKATKSDIMLMSIAQTGGWRGIVTKSKQIKTPADLKNLKIRTIESPLQQTMIKNAGGSPTPLPYSEVYTAATTGVIEGALLSVSDVVNAKLNETMKFITLDRFAYMTNMWFIGNKKFQKLTAAEKKIVLDGARLFADVTYGVQPWKELKSFEAFKKTGGKIYVPTAAEMGEFKKQAAPVREWYLGQYGEEGKSFLAAVEKNIDVARKKVDADNAAVVGLK